MSIVELRQYTLRPGRRDELIDLFERKFVDSQEAAGMTLIGQFRDLDDPDRFVWLRGFPDMESRNRALEAFYFGPVWQAHRDAANATMIDSDDVLLLRPLDEATAILSGERRPVGREPSHGEAAICGVHRLADANRLSARFPAGFASMLEGSGLRLSMLLTTERAANTFPALPVREGESVLAWLALVPADERGDAAFDHARSASTALFGTPLQMMRLQPTARSRLRG